MIYTCPACYKEIGILYGINGHFRCWECSDKEYRKMEIVESEKKKITLQKCQFCESELKRTYSRISGITCQDCKDIQRGKRKIYKNGRRFSTSNAQCKTTQ